MTKRMTTTHNNTDKALYVCMTYLLLVSDDAFTLLQFGQKLRDTQLQTAGVSGLYYGALRLDLYKLRLKKKKRIKKIIGVR